MGSLHPLVLPPEESKKPRLLNLDCLLVRRVANLSYTAEKKSTKEAASTNDGAIRG